MSTILDFGIPGVSSTINQPKRNNLWRVTFAGVGGGNDSTPLSAQAISVTRPKISWNELEQHRYNSTAFIATKHTWEPCNAVFQDDVASTASKIIQAQMQKQQWVTGAEGQWLAVAAEGSLYKFTAYMDLMDGNDAILERWVLEGAWLREVDFGSLEYSANPEAVTISVVLRYDHAFQMFNQYSGAGSAIGGAGSTEIPATA